MPLHCFDRLSECPCCGTQVFASFPPAVGVPYSVVVLAETGAGRGAESEREIFFSKELGELVP